jgi:predicted transcriptional regulator YdeE
VINAPIETVYKSISDFHSWTTWSPWLVAEPEAKVAVRKDGKFYSWEGDIVGAGEMTISNEVENESVAIDLLFLKPWKSKAKVHFTMKEEEGGVRVMWDMDSSLPFFMFWMKKMMEAFVGNDYQRGLTMLKDYAEIGKVPATLSVKGMEEFKGCTYIGIKHDNVITSEMSTHMEADYTKLLSYMKDGREKNMAGPSFSIYHKWDMVNGKASYTACVPVNEVPSDLPAGVITGSVPATKVHVMHQTGPYRYIGNIWSAQYMRLRSKKFKGNKGVHPMERYLNSPTNTEENNLETEVLFAVK